MKKIISFVGLFAVLGVGIGDAHGVAMSAQVRRLLQEKQEKIEQLEKCEGKKQGWMIAGISTIGLTAVGVGVNIAQASKSNRLSSEIEMEKSTLERHQNELNRIQNDIATERAKQAKDEQQTQKGADDLPKYVPAGGGKYDDYKLTCDTVRFTFDKVDDYSAVLASLNVECQRVMKRNMVNLTELGLGSSNASKVVFECSGYKESLICESNGGIVLNGGVIGQPCAEGIENIANSKFTGVWTRDDKGQYTCHATANDSLPIPCACKKMEGGNGVEPVTPVKLDQNCRTSYGKKPTTDCPCDGNKGLSLGTDGTCVCSDSNTKWNGQKCARNSVEPVPPITPIPPKPTEPEYDEIDLKNCRLSGGEWRYRDQYKRWECFCGINQSGSDKNMVQTSGFKTCACKKDYIWIDDNDHSKGCKRGISAAENADLNKITNLYGRFERIVNSMDTKAGQAGRAATAASGASKAADARKYADQAKNYFDEINTLYMEAGALYEEINALISGLSTELRSKVSTYIKDADTLNSRLGSIVQKARSAASEAEKAVVALENLAAAGDTCKTVQCQKCVDTGGKWEELVDGTAFCRCDRKQGLVSDSSKMLYCKPAN